MSSPKAIISTSSMDLCEGMSVGDGSLKEFRHSLESNFIRLKVNNKYINILFRFHLKEKRAKEMNICYEKGD